MPRNQPSHQPDEHSVVEPQGEKKAEPESENKPESKSEAASPVSKTGEKTEAARSARTSRVRAPAPDVSTAAKKTVNGNRRSTAKRAPAADDGPKKIVVREGGAVEPSAEIVTGMAPDEAARQRQEAEKLLAITEEALTKLGARRLDGQREETVSQIQNYVGGSRSALKEGDISRAHTLAMKASLLAADLAKH